MANRSTQAHVFWGLFHAQDNVTQGMYSTTRALNDWCLQVARDAKGSAATFESNNIQHSHILHAHTSQDPKRHGDFGRHRAP